jgi:tetratricopeptide (TPR) repeat protein/DNA-binding CsgD family transcriptional regulator
MEKGPLPFEQQAFNNHLQTFDAIKLTRREIDIIACIVSGRGGKATAALLSIAEKTVETHTRNIMLKFECNSHEGIREKIEKSKDLPLIRYHYLNLLAKNSFEKHLQKVSTLINNEHIVCYVIYWKCKGAGFHFIEKLQKNLHGIGIKILIEVCESNKPNFQRSQLSFQNVDHIICFIPEGEKHSSKVDESIIQKDISQLSQEHFSSGRITFITEANKRTVHKHEGKNNFIYINVDDSSGYYFFFFNLLQKILNTLDVQTIISNFKNEFDIIFNLPKELSTQGETNKTKENKPKTLSSINLENKENVSTTIPLTYSKTSLSNKVQYFIKERRSFLFIAGVFFLLVTGSLISILASRYIDTSMQRVPLDKTTIHSDLAIPAGTILLKRPQLLSQIDSNFKEKNKAIKTIALVGIGGAGKTTLAREYARTQKSHIVWEINCESKEGLTSSFENMAYTLSNTEEEKKELRGLQETKDLIKREEKILAFVKEKLRSYPNWFLIYDNIEKLPTIQNHFPNDSNVWGSGNVIITTRDSNISNNSHVDSTLYVGALTPSEKRNLFNNIMNIRENKKSSSLQVEKTDTFLQEIPPFPLDVSLAAYYIKSTNVTYEKYLKYLKELEKDFIITQESILKEASEYTKTRYHIIALSLQRIAHAHKDFKELLLLFSLIDSQNIPREFLESYKNGPIVDNFIYNLKKYSFFVNDNSKYFSDLSIHRSTQQASFAYLTKSLNVKKDDDSLLKIANYLASYVSNLTEKEDVEKIKPLLTHYETFLTHTSLLNDYTKGKVEEGLGKICLHLGQFQKAAYLLQESLTKLNKNDNKNYRNHAETLMHLGNAYREIGNYDEAICVLEESLRLYHTYVPNEPLGIARTSAHLGNVYRNLGNHKKAENLLKESLLIYKKHLPENHLSLAQVFALLGNVYRDLGELEESKNLFEKSLAIYEQNFPKNYLGNAWILARLGNIYKNLGNYEKAKGLLEGSLAIYKKNFSESYHGTAWALANLGNVYKDLGEIKKSKSLLEKSIKIYTHIFSKNHIDIAWVSIHLGNIYRDFGDLEEAKNILEAGIRIYKKKFTNEHIGVAWALVHLANIYAMLGRHQEAKALLEANLIIFKKNYPENHVYVAWILAHLASVYKNVGNYEKSIALLEKSLNSYKNMYGENHNETARILKELGSVYILKNDIEKGENLIRRSLRIYSKNNHYDRYKCYEILSDIYSIKSNQALSKKNTVEFKEFKEQAAYFLNQAFIIVKNHFPTRSSHNSRIQQSYNVYNETN